MAPPRPYLLVVDDMADAADSMTLLLTLWGYSAEARYSGESALAAAATRRPQAILLDIGMPKMCGFDFLARYRELPGGVATAVVVVSGHTDTTTRARARQMGIAHYLLKPADPNEIRILLETLTRGPALRAEVHLGGRGPRPDVTIPWRRSEYPHAWRGTPRLTPVPPPKPVNTAVR